MPRTTPIQETFASGELSPRAQGQVSSALYKAGSSRIANLLIQPEGGLASRAGAIFIHRSTSTPTPLISLDGCGVEGLVWDGTHIYNQRGMVWNTKEYSEIKVENIVANVTGTFAADNAVWSDEKSQRLYIRAKSTGAATSNWGRATVTNNAAPAGNHRLEFTHSGDPVRVIVQNSGGVGTYLDTTVNPGSHVLTFDALGNNVFVDFMITTAAVNGDMKAANIWGLCLSKGGSFNVGGGLTGTKYCAFWKSGVFYVVTVSATGTLTGVFRNTTLADRTTAEWQTLGLAGEFANVPAGTITAVAAYQERLWICYDTGRIVATQTGYGAGVPLVFAFTPILSPPKAAGPLDLNLSSKGRAITWLLELRGLMMGTEALEMNFSQKQALALDASTGLTFDVTEHSWYGSDRNLNALAVLNRILFAVHGRQRFRLAAFDFESYGGFEGEDFGVLGEHLTRARVRSWCVVKSPVPRVILVMDDGTVAVATVPAKGVTSWCRLSLPAPCDRVLSVASTETKFGTDLWLNTENGYVLRIPDVDSVLRGVTVMRFSATATPIPYSDWSLDPVVMDVGLRVPVQDVGGGVKKLATTSIPVDRSGAIGSNLYPDSSIIPNLDVLLTGAYQGLLANGAGALAGCTVTGLAAETYIDANGRRQPSEGFVGLKFIEHRATTLKHEGDNPNGTSQAMKGRHVDVWLRVSDSYMPLVNGERAVIRDAADNPLANNQYVTGDVLAKGLGYTVGTVLDIVQDLPFRVEVEAIFGVSTANEL